jgi:hypothetical protein
MTSNKSGQTMHPVSLNYPSQMCSHINVNVKCFSYCEGHSDHPHLQCSRFYSYTTLPSLQTKLHTVHSENQSIAMEVRHKPGQEWLPQLAIIRQPHILMRQLKGILNRSWTQMKQQQRCIKQPQRRMRQAGHEINRFVSQNFETALR